MKIEKKGAEDDKNEHTKQLPRKKTSLHLISEVSADITSEHHLLLREQSHRIVCLFVSVHNK